jgi:4-diphosphocytidyl-2C-methyl-D-erythritol kinase
VLSPAGPVRGWAVLVRPGVAVSTPRIYSDWDSMAPMPGQGAPGAPDGGGNDLAPPAIRRHPLIGKVLDEVGGAAHAGRVFMTGSGPTVVALYPGEAEARRGHSALAAIYKDRADVDAVILAEMI